MGDRLSLIRIEETDERLEGLIVLSEGGISREQARATLELFPDGSDARNVVEYFFNTSPREFSGYGDFLNALRRAIEGKCRIPKTDFDALVAERTAQLPIGALLQGSYRDKPTRSSHFYEHFASRMDS